MSIATSASLYQERTGQVTTREVIDRCLDDLRKPKAAGASFHLPNASSWRRPAWTAPSRPLIAGLPKPVGPRESSPARRSRGRRWPPARWPRYAISSSAHSIAHRHREARAGQTPGKNRHDQRQANCACRCSPLRGMFDSVLFAGFRADVWMQPGVTPENLATTLGLLRAAWLGARGHRARVGGGQRQQHRPTDAFSKLFQEGKVVLLKMNPVNEYLGGIFAQAFVPLIEAGFLRIIYGGADVGTYAVEHELVDEVHITGSIFSHETIVWGPPGPDRERRKADGAVPLQSRHHERIGQRHPVDRRSLVRTPTAS